MSSSACGLPTLCNGLLHFIKLVGSALKATCNYISLKWFTSLLYCIAPLLLSHVSGFTSISFLWFTSLLY